MVKRRDILSELFESGAITPIPNENGCIQRDQMPYVVTEQEIRESAQPITRILEENSVKEITEAEGRRFGSLLAESNVDEINVLETPVFETIDTGAYNPKAIEELKVLLEKTVKTTPIHIDAPSLLETVGCETEEQKVHVNKNGDSFPAEPFRHAQPTEEQRIILQQLSMLDPMIHAFLHMYEQGLSVFEVLIEMSKRWIKMANHLEKAVQRQPIAAISMGAHVGDNRWFLAGVPNGDPVVRYGKVTRLMTECYPDWSKNKVTLWFKLFDDRPHELMCDLNDVFQTYQGAEAKRAEYLEYMKIAKNVKAK